MTSSSFPIYYFKDDNHNVGDLLPLFILPKLFPELRFITHDPNSPSKIVSVGSVLQHAVRPSDIIWGTGLIQPTTPHLDPSTITILALRGPRALQIFKSPPSNHIIYGDPGLLVSEISEDLDTSRRRYTAYVPHYVDKTYLAPELYPTVDIDLTIDITSSLLNILDLYAQCHTVISTSLHGLIIAEATRVPRVVWAASPSNKIIGGSFKFLSYLEGTGRFNVRPPTLSRPTLLPLLTTYRLAKIQRDLIRVMENYLRS